VKTLLLRLEPLIWMLFGAGMMAGAFLFPAWILVVGLAVPLGIAPAEALAYDRAFALASSLPGRALLAAAIALPLWGGAHHLRHLAIDFGGLARDAWAGALFYGIALGGSLLAVVAVARL
jgi:fumarate reductase subunit D